MAGDAPVLPSPKSLGTVLVIGGCGFLGKHVVDQLLNFPSESNSAEKVSLGANSGRYAHELQPLSGRYPSFDQSGTKVHALDLRCTKNRLPGCTYHEADITNAAQLLEVFKKVQPDVVINTAAPQFDAKHDILKKVNIEGTRTLIEVAGGQHGSWGTNSKVCKAFVHTSSASVIHDTQSNLNWADERYPLQVPNKNEYYSETKALAERIVLTSNGTEDVGGMLTAAVRPAGITGEGDMGGIAYSLCQNASVAPKWQVNLQLGEGDNLFDVTYAGNVALGLLLVAEGLLSTRQRIEKTGNKDGGILDNERIDGEVFIVTNDAPAYFWDITRFVYSRYGRNDARGRTGVTAVPEGFGSLLGLLAEIAGTLSGKKGRFNRQTVRYSCIDRYFSCEKIKRRCGYLPVVDVEESLLRSVRWYKELESAGEVKKSQ